MKIERSNNTRQNVGVQKEKHYSAYLLLSNEKKNNSRKKILIVRRYENNFKCCAIFQLMQTIFSTSVHPWTQKPNQKLGTVFYPIQNEINCLCFNISKYSSISLELWKNYQFEEIVRITGRECSIQSNPSQLYS